MGRFHRRVESAVLRSFAVINRWLVGACVILFVAAVIWGFGVDGTRETTRMMEVYKGYWTAWTIIAVLLGYPLGAIVLREP